MARDGAILVLNAGSSSIKFAVFPGGADEMTPRQLSGGVSGVGEPDAQLSIRDGDGRTRTHAVGGGDHAGPIAAVLDAIGGRGFEKWAAVGHRIVHGGPNHFLPQRIDAALLAEFRRIVDFAPEHLPQAIALIEAVERRFGSVLQVACFDTGFGRDLPVVSRLLALPRRLEGLGVRRYGFHGLSYEYLMRELARIGRAGEARGRVILAHLGNGASLAAVRDAKAIDTSMGMTPAGGLIMSTRSGDIDPGIVRFLERQERLSPEKFDRMINHESGLLGISQRSGDLRQLTAAASTDARAAEAVEMFCYCARKWIGAFAAILGGLDTLVFAGGIGEHQPDVRWRICQGLGFMGIQIERERNEKNAAIISADGAAATVRVMATDEEDSILRGVRGVMGNKVN
jgi:acetate kinase